MFSILNTVLLIVVLIMLAKLVRSDNVVVVKHYNYYSPDKRK